MKMRKYVGKTAAVVLASLMLAGPVLGTISVYQNDVIALAKTAAQEEYEKKLQEAEDNKAALEKKKREAERMLEELKKEKESISAYIDELDIQLNAVALEFYELEQKVEKTEAELEITREELEAAKQKEAEQYETMKRRIRYMYENDEQSYLEALLGAASITDILNQIEYMYRITEYDNNLLDRYKEAKQAVIDKEAYLEASLEELKTLEEAKRFEQETLETLMAAKSEEIERYTQQIGITDELLFEFLDEISSQEMEIEEIKEMERLRREEEERLRKEEEERLRREAEAAAAAAKGKEIPPSTSGYDASAINDVVLTDETSIYNMIWPLPGDYRTYAKFGPRIAPTAGASTYHRGWDIGGEFGAPIVAVLAGKVVTSTYSQTSGNYIRVDHGQGVVTAYLHCSKLLVDVGDYVQQGQQVGLVGSTGVSTGPHLHFGLAVNGVYIDPDPYLPY